MSQIPCWMRAYALAAVAAFVACGGHVGGSPPPGSCSGTTLAASTPATIMGEPGISGMFPAALTVQAFAAPGGLLVITGGTPNAPQPIQAWRVAVGAEGTPSVSSATIADASRQPFLRGAAAAPGTGDVAVLWSASNGGSAGTETVFVTTVQGDGNTPRVMPAITLNSPFDLVTAVAFDGTGFAVFARDPEAGFGMLRVSLDGTVSGGPLTGLGSQNPAATSMAASTPSGAALAWSEASPGAGRSHVSLIRDDGSIAKDAILDSLPTWTGTRVLAVVPSPNGAATTQVVDLGWFGEPPWTMTVPGYGIPSLNTVGWRLLDGGPVEGNGQILIATSATPDATSAVTVYGAAPGKPFAALGNGIGPAALGADGCGHWLFASAPPQDTSSPYEHGGPWNVTTLGPTPQHLSVGSDLPFMYMAGGSFVQTPAGLGFVWNEASEGSAPSTVRFATLGWRP